MFSVEKKLADLERELDEKEGWLKDAEDKLNDVEARLDQETRGREQVRNRPNQDTLVTDWLITSHVT